MHSLPHFANLPGIGTGAAAVLGLTYLGLVQDLVRMTLFILTYGLKQSFTHDG
jgi:hypothetical protein